jgi:hypothetical protein
VSKRAGPPSQQLECDEIEEKTQPNKLNLVYFGDFEGPLFKTFDAIATDNEVYKFFHASGECAHEHKGKHNSLSIFRSFDKSPIHLGSLPRDQASIE